MFHVSSPTGRRVSMAEGERRGGVKTEFALRLGDWVIWNYGDWNAQGWIQLDMLCTITDPGIRRTIYRVTWNGQRFARSSDLGRLASKHPDAPATLELLLLKHVPRLAEAA